MAQQSSTVHTAQEIFQAIQKLPSIQRDALLFAACTNHADVAARVFEAIEENEAEVDDEDEEDDESEDEEDEQQMKVAASRKVGSKTKK